MKEYSNECLYKDTYTIILMMDEKLRSNISPKFIEFLKNNQDDTFIGTINNKKPLKEQELRYEIKLMLSLIYINYMCDESTQNKIRQKDAENIEKFYNRNIFNEVTPKEKINKTQNEVVEMTVYKESFIDKIIKKIKKILRKE